MTRNDDVIPIFAGLSRAEAERILGLADDLTFPAGARIFTPGMPCDGFYVLVEGRVEIRKPDPASGEVRLAVLTSRATFGEMALVADRARSSAAIAMEPTKVKRVPKRAFDVLLAADDLAAYKLIRGFAKLITERLKKTEEELLGALREVNGEKRETKLAELQAFRQKLFDEWSF